MTYEEAITSNVTKAEARREVELHSLLWSDFVADCGDHEEYDGSEVLGWLGY